MTRIEDLLCKNEFSALSANQKEILAEALRQCDGKDQSAVILIFAKYIPLLEKEGAITPQEKRAIINCVTESLDKNERETAEKMLDAARGFGFRF